MPSTIVKLCSGDARAWRVNQPVWLDEDGTVVRAVLPEEQDAISACLASSLHVQESFRQELELKKKQPTPHRANPRRREPNPVVMFAFEVTWINNRRVVTTFLGNLRYATGREVVSARLLAEHGECILHGPNGKCMGVLRDPLILERPPQTGKRVQWSRNPEQEAIEAAKRVEFEERQSARRGRGRAGVRREAPAARKIELALYSPEKCPNDCRGIRSGQGWAIPKGAEPPAENEHHPVCMHAPAWASTLVPATTRMVIYDLATSRVMRDALPNEVEEARIAKDKTGVAQVQLQGQIYAVLSAEDAETAAREARGESVESATTEGAAEGASPEPSAEPTPTGRDAWPMLSSLRPQHSGRQVQKRDHVSPADYLRHGSHPASAGGVG